MGQGNFGKVCVAFISYSSAIRDEEQTKIPEVTTQLPLKSGIKRHFSFRKQQYTVNYNYDTSNPVQLNQSQQDQQQIVPLMPKEARKVAAKMVKGMLFLLQYNHDSYYRHLQAIF